MATEMTSATASSSHSTASDDDFTEEFSLDKCLSFKTEGNAFFKNGDFAEALTAYRQGIDAARHKPPYVGNERSPYPSGETGGETEDDGHKEELNTCKESPLTSSSEMAETEEEKEAYTLTAQLYANAAACLMRLDDPSLEEAVMMLSEALRHQPDYAKARLRRAECYYTLEKYASAVEDYDAYEKGGGQLCAEEKQHQAHAKGQQEQEVKKMLGDLKDLGNKFLGWFNLSTDNFKFDKDPNTGSYSMRFEQ